jgi:adenylyl-sulfate kinase
VGTQLTKVIWFTGLSGSGKTTLATLLGQYLETRGFKCCLLDGDVVRKGLNKDLGFSDDDRRENIRRIAEVSRLMIDAGLVVLAAFVSPYEADRKMMRGIVGDSNVIEVFVDCPLEVCERRDTKALYKKVRAGLIRNFTGVDAPYERPLKPDLVLNTDKLSEEESMKILVEKVTSQL